MEMLTNEYSHCTERGKETFLRCKEHESCGYMVRKIEPRDSFDILFEFSGVHSSTIKEPKSKGLSDHDKKLIESLFVDKIRKPKAILKAFQNRQLPEPNKGALKNFLAKLRNKYQGPSTISLGELEKQAQSLEFAVDDDTAFVVGMKIEYQPINFIIALTTKRLLENGKKGDLIAIDSTYKLNWQGYPIVLLGTIDADKHFHPIIATLVYKEDKDTFQFLFELLVAENYTPELIMSDAAEAIKAGARTVFPNAKILDCWMHTRKYFLDLAILCRLV